MYIYINIQHNNTVYWDDSFPLDFNATLGVKPIDLLHRKYLLATDLFVGKFIGL